jgi:hypothetical protein
MFRVQNAQNQECLYMADTVPAASQKLGKVSVSNLGHFFCRYITGTFTTIENIGAVTTDTGIDYLRGKLIDGSNMRPLFNDYVPFSLWSVPGRRKSLTTGGSDSFQLHIVFPFEYLFQMNGDILMDVKNDSTLEANAYSLAFWGVRIKSSETTAGL